MYRLVLKISRTIFFIWKNAKPSFLAGNQQIAKKRSLRALFY